LIEQAKISIGEKSQALMTSSSFARTPGTSRPLSRKSCCASDVKKFAGGVKKRLKFF
jgi:hypothetical protein